MKTLVRVVCAFTSGHEAELWPIGRIESVDVAFAIPWAQAGLVQLLDPVAAFEITPPKLPIEEQLMADIPGLKIENVIVPPDAIREAKARAREEAAMPAPAPEEIVEKQAAEANAAVEQKALVDASIEEAHRKEVAQKQAKKERKW